MDRLVGWDHVLAIVTAAKRFIAMRSVSEITIVLSILGFCLVGCASWKPDPAPACDESQRQAHGISSLPGCSPVIRKTSVYDKT
jgi:hypothetical protein